MSNAAAVMHELGSISIEERPDPAPGPLDAVVHVEAVGICGSDVAYFEHGRIGDYVVDGPIVLGHEAAGRVTAIGAEVTTVRVGDRVAIEPGTPCRDCRECLAGRYHLCPRLVFLATPPYDGALLQQLVIDSRCLFGIPDPMSYEEAALVEPLSVGLWACHRAALAPGDDVLVTGAGPVGLLAGLAALARGAGTVTVTDVAPDRLDLAAQLGLGTERSDDPSSQEFDVLMECSGAPGVLAAGLGRLREAGRAAVVGMTKGADVPLPLAQLNPKELTISLVNRYAHTWPTAIRLIASGRIDVRPLVTHRFPLTETARALATTGTPGAVKVVIEPNA